MRRTPAAQGARDANHAEIAAFYESLYCQVLDLSTVGRGCPDMLVRIPTRAGGVLALVEVKVAGGKLTPSQERFMAEWGPGVIEVVTTQEDVMAHVERIRANAR